jgi:hypothetical protein
MSIKPLRRAIAMVGESTVDNDEGTGQVCARGVLFVPSSRLRDGGIVSFLDLDVVQTIQRHLRLPLWTGLASIRDSG